MLGLAYWCKGGLALAPFVVLAGVAVANHRVRSLVPALQSAGMFLIVVASERLYWMAHFPLEFRFEEKAQLAHIFEVVEQHRGPWYTYVVDFMPAMITPPLILVAYFSIAWTVREWQPGKAQFTTALWVLVYLVPLSIGKSKIENFIFAVIPAVALLIPYVIEHLVESRRFSLVIALCVSSLSAFVVSRVARVYDNPERLILLVTLVVFGASFGIVFLIGFGSRWFTLALLAATCLALFLSFVHRNSIANNRKPADSSAQALLRVTGSELRAVVETDGLILLHSSMVELAYLYVMYWSGVDVLDVCLQNSATDTIARLRDRTKLYLVTDEVLPAVPIRKVPLGSLYSLKDIPFDEWAPSATVDCKAKLLPR